jgi:hypothetical protein
MSHTVPTQHPAVVLRPTYQHLRALLAIAAAAILGLTVAVVVLATNSHHGTLASPTSQSATHASPLTETGAKLDHSGRNLTAADRLATYPDAPPPSTSDQVHAPIQAPAAQLGFNSGSVGQALAGQLGFNRGSVGQAPAAQLGFNRGPLGQAAATALGFNPRPVSQAQRSDAVSGGGQ